MAFQDIVPYDEFNWIAIVTAAVSSMILGSLWYSPWAFGKAWMAAIGKTMDQIKADKKGTRRAYLGSAVASFVLAIGMAILVSQTFATTAIDGVLAGLVAAICFVATALGAGALFEGKPLKLYLIGTGYHVVTLAIMGIILAVWQ